MNNEGFLLLFEAMMEQAYKDLGDKNPKIREEAEGFVRDMKNKFSSL